MFRAVICAAVVLSAAGCSKPDATGAAPRGDAAAGSAAATTTPPVASATAAAAVGPSAKNACEVAPPAEVSAALGDTFTDGREQERAVPSVSNCLYTGAAPGKTLNIRVEKITRAGYDATTKTLRNGNPVEGVGEAAYSHLVSRGVVIATFLAFKSGNLVAITYGGMDLKADAAVAAEKKLATKLLAKL